LLCISQEGSRVSISMRVDLGGERDAGLLSLRRIARLRPAQLWPWALLLLMALLVAAPLGFLVLGSFSSGRLLGEIDFGALSLDNYRVVWGNPATHAVFANTVIYALGAVSIGVPLALSLAFLVERTNIPGKLWIYTGVTLCLAMPGLLHAMAYVLLLSPKIGFINRFLMNAFDLEAAPFNIYGLAGMALVEGMRLVPTAFLMMLPLLRNMDPALEEAASTSGAGPIYVLRRVTMLLMLPGIVAVLIYQLVSALEVFDVPSIVGMPGGIYVFSTRIYAALHSTSALPDYGKANALAILYLVIAVAMTTVYLKVISRAERFSVVSGRGYRPRTIDLGAWRWVALALACLYLLAAFVLPFLVLAYTSFLPFLQVPSARAFHAFSWINYRKVFESDEIGVVVRNTLIMTALAASLTLVLSFLISLVIVRSKFWGRKLLDQLAFLPHAIPGIVMGLALLWVFLKIDNFGLPIFGTIWSMALAFTLTFVAYGTRAMNAAILQIHRDLEEAALMSGASTWRTAWRVFVPLLAPALAGLWLWAVLHAVRTAGLPLMLYQGANNQVLSVMIWNMWTDGQIAQVGAVATIMILALLALTLLLRSFGFGRASSH
jgi:iron(III) transport system permease protein